MNKVITKLLTTLSILVLLVACACKPPHIEPRERCSISFEFNYGSEEEINEFFEYITEYKHSVEARKYFLREVLEIFGKARCHRYDLMTAKRVSEAEDFPLSTVDDLIGFHAEDWMKNITPWAKESYRYYKDLKKRK